MLRLNALGRLTLTDEEGRNFAPHGSKARGLIVLLAAAPGHACTRKSLQERLWSDRAAEQAAGSLRAALSEIRRSLGPHRRLLVASRHAVSLDPAGFEVVYQATAEMQIGGAVEAFDDVDVRDREFQHVIRDVRRQMLQRWDNQKRAQPRFRRIVLLRSDARGAPAADVGARLLQNRILSALRQIDDLEIVSVGGANDADELDAPSGQPRSMLLIRVLSVALSDGVFLSCEVHGERRLWADNASVPGTIQAMLESVDLDRLAQNTVEYVCDAFAEAATIAGANACAFVLARQARILFFQLDKGSLVDADRLFRRAFEIEPRGRYLVWRAFLRNAAFFQHRSMSFLDNAAPATELAVEALRHSPEDAAVQIIGSQIEYIHHGDLRTSLQMAQRGVERDPTDPLGWALLSNALITNGMLEEGYRTAQRALELTKHSPFQFYFEHFACMAAAARADYDQALLHTRTALRLRPDFVSTRRYEVALNLRSDEVPQLRQAVNALRRHEPSFLPTTLLDPTYPVNTLRRLPILAAIERKAATRLSDVLES